MVVYIFLILKANSKNPWFGFSKIGPREEREWMQGGGWERQLINIEGSGREKPPHIWTGWSWDHPHLALLVIAKVLRSYKNLASPQNSRPIANCIPDTSTGWLTDSQTELVPSQLLISLTKHVPSPIVSSASQQRVPLPNLGPKLKNCPWQPSFAHPTPTSNRQACSSGPIFIIYLKSIAPVHSRHQGLSARVQQQPPPALSTLSRLLAAARGII